MKIVLSAVMVVILMIGAPLVYAETAYQSGYRHGVADAVLDTEPHCGNPMPPHPNCLDDYIIQPGKGFAFHTTEFVDGYIHGWCLDKPSGGGVEANDDPTPTLASFDCDKGLSSAYPHSKDWPN